MVGARIARYRKNKKMSQRELGTLVHIDQTLISRIERGERRVTSDELVQFARALGVSVSELLNEDQVKEVV
ncbi:hypothetical protein SD70_27760 [Gordoniibacillus kamchatkensis]|uniref:HTH cro/C1-type domain-containing protein n=2 Tax=Gordoniibacillus kamchatkensis TaxID=1590651 RepID=A0ABR5AB66_9BACL|nr:hypothetical protein SD70_27760 [Paenibacillus sp. VKM B-2647]